MKLRALVIGLVLPLCSSGVAAAAGGGYGPSAAVPVNVPGGFRQALVVHTLPIRAELLKVRVPVGAMDISVLGGTFVTPVQIAVTRGNDVGVARSLTGALAGDRTLLSAGVVLDNSGRPVTSAREIVVTLHNPNLRAGDLVVEFRDGGFHVVGVVGRAGVVRVAVRGVTEFAILEHP